MINILIEGVNNTLLNQIFKNIKIMLIYPLWNDKFVILLRIHVVKFQHESILEYKFTVIFGKTHSPYSIHTYLGKLIFGGAIESKTF